MPFGLNTKSVVAGLLLGYFVAPRVTSIVMGQVSKLRGTPAGAA